MSVAEVILIVLAVLWVLSSLAGGPRGRPLTGPRSVPPRPHGDDDIPPGDLEDES